MLRSVIAASSLMVAACTDPAVYQQNVKSFENFVGYMDCAELAAEHRYQDRILKGLASRQSNEATPADSIATVFTLGYNAASNSVDREDRGNRMTEIQQRIQIIESEQLNQRCAK